MFNSNKVQLWLALCPIMIALVIGIIIVTVFRILPPKLPLFYSLPWGEAQLATEGEFLIIPANIALIAILNFLLSQQLHPSQSFFKKILIFSSLVSTLILIVTFIKIVLIFI